MITSAFLNIIFDAISFLVGKLPDVAINNNLVNAISTASSYISAIHDILPYTIIAVLAIISFDLAFEAGYLLYKVIYWIIRRFPTQS